MDPEPDQVGPSQNHQLFYNLNNPDDTMVMLKNIQHMGYFHKSQVHDDGSGKQVFKSFPNYFILNNITVAHKQKQLLHVMLNQETDPQIMIEQFCKLARECYPDKEDEKQIQKLKKDFLNSSISAGVILRWYSKDTFFYRLLNRLLRAGKDSTEVYYGQHFTKLLTQAIKQFYQKQKNQKRQQVSETLKCYRGAFFTQKQIEVLKNNIGKHIQTLGFMSTSTNQQVAKRFIGNGNTFVEIEVSSDVPKDSELDLGYAYLGKHSEYDDEEQVLFNVLSSFQIKSVDKIEHQGREVWHIKLQYGVTYQMAYNYKQNKLRKGTPQQQLIRAILSWQNTFKEYKCQEKCLQQQNEVDKYIWLKKTKISLLKSIPHLQCRKQIGQIEQFNLYDKLTTDKRFKGKQQKYVKQIEPKYLSSINSESNSQSVITLWQNMINIYYSISNHYGNQNYESVQQLAKKWRRLKQQLLSNIQFQQQADPQLIEDVEQWQTTVSVYQTVANILLLDKKGDIQKLVQQIQAAQPLLQHLLTKYDRYNRFYMDLKQCCMYSADNHGFISYEAWLELQQQKFTMLNGIKVDQINTFIAKLVQMQKQANRFVQQKQWAEAVRLCAEFRDEHYKGREHQDNESFQPIIRQLNKFTNNLVEKLQILQTCLSVQHPKHSAFYKSAEKMWRILKQTQLQLQKLYMNKVQEVIAWPAEEQLTELFRLKQEFLPQFIPKDSMLWIITECLIVNALRMAGRYQRAYKYAEQLKKQYSAAKHFQLFRQCHRQLLN